MHWFGDALERLLAPVFERYSRGEAHTVSETSTSPGGDSAEIRAAMFTAPPQTLLRPSRSDSRITSPAWRPRGGGSGVVAGAAVSERALDA